MRLSKLWIVGAVVAVLLALPPIASAQVPGSASPVVPNFWDPMANVERPAAGAVTTIRFVTTSDYPPFNFLEAGGRLTGFNVDLARAICRRLLAACTIQARPWEDIVPALEEGRADAAIAGIAIGPESRTRVSFSSVYLRSPGRFAARRDRQPSELSVPALRGWKVGVVAKTAHEAYLDAFFSGAERKAFDSPEAARAALKGGEIDLLFGDGIRLSFWLQGETAANCCSFVGGPYLDSHFFGQGFAIAVAPQAVELRRAINAALEDMHDSGTYAELYLRYFPVGFF